MAESDRQRLLERALALPHASASDFFGDRRPPPEADPNHLRVINDTNLRTRLIEAGLAEGLQSPKGPQKIASILRIYPNFDAPRLANGVRNGRPPGRAPGRPAGRARGASIASSPARVLPTLEEMETLIARIREVERQVAGELSAEVDGRIEHLKRAIADQHGEALETTYRELGAALEQKRALAAHARAEAFRRVEGDQSFAPRAFLRLLAR
jgi:hypothetical protein